MKTRKCKFCDTMIFWARNVATGKLVPLEVDSNKRPTTRFVLIDDRERRDDDEALRCETVNVTGYRSHYEGKPVPCPGADKARKR